MQWWYKKIESSDHGHVYAYSHDSKALDGRITYETSTERAIMTTPSATDGKSDWALGRSLRHFYGQVVNEGFPDERHVCCG